MENVIGHTLYMSMSLSVNAYFSMSIFGHVTSTIIRFLFSGSGFKLAPVVGKILVRLAFGLDPGYNIEPFRVDRFQKSPKSSL